MTCRTSGSRRAGRDPPAEHRGAVRQAGDRAPAPREHRLDAGLGDLGGVAVEEAGQRALRPGRRPELGVGEARREARDAHARPRELLVDRFGERLHERLARRVRGEAGERLVGGDRRDVEHRAGARLEHPRQERARELHHRLDVHPHEPQLAFRVELREPPDRPEAGVVADAEDLPLQARDQRLPRGGVGEVARGDLGGAPELVRERAEPLLAPRHEGHAVPARRKSACKLGADARRRARDQDRAAVRRRRKRHGSKG